MNLPAAFAFGLAGLVLMSAPAASAPAASTPAAEQGKCDDLGSCKMYCDVYETDDDGCKICKCATDTDNMTEEQINAMHKCPDDNPNCKKGLYDGDMLMTAEEIEATFGEGGDRASIKGGRWPTTIHYTFESGFPSGGRSAVRAAIAQYHAKTCLKFVQGKSSSGSYLQFYSGGGCSSPVGHRRGRVNRISLARGCWRIGTVMHEIGHSIGLYHEQSRPDRDNYVEILWGNIKGGMDFNFRKQPSSNIDSLGTKYDYDSMMHYGPYGFGEGSMTIRTKDRSAQNRIGQRTGPSETDVIQINRMYCGGGQPIPSQAALPVTLPAEKCVDAHTNCSDFEEFCDDAHWLTHMTKYCAAGKVFDCQC